MKFIVLILIFLCAFKSFAKEDILLASCDFINPPLAIQNKLANDAGNGCAKIYCVGMANCTMSNIDVVIPVACTAKGNTCPSATDCALDGDVKIENPANNSPVIEKDVQRGSNGITK